MANQRNEQAIYELLHALSCQPSIASTVVPWSCPIPVFGDIESSRVASVGLNPSDREFLDTRGYELTGPERRFPTLTSLGLRSWNDARDEHMRAIYDACRIYFESSPYNAWFRQLEDLITSTGVSYYLPGKGACHLDLVPYATWRKWGALTPSERSALKKAAHEPISRMISESNLRLLVLNGETVVRSFEELAGTELDAVRVPEWTLKRSSGTGVPGTAYSKVVTTLAGVTLPSTLAIVGFNHNIQSSYGVTRRVRSRIRQWIAEMYDGVVNEAER